MLMDFSYKKKGCQGKKQGSGVRIQEPGKTRKADVNAEGAKETEGAEAEVQMTGARGLKVHS